MRRLILSFGLILMQLPAQVPVPFLGLGDSIGEGVQSADASWRTQPSSYLNLIARQMGVPFPLPLIESGPLGIMGDTTVRSRLRPFLAASNLSISGADVNDLLKSRPDRPIDSETDLVLLPRTGSQVEIAESLRPPFLICWIGSNDVLRAVASFDHLDASQMTPVPVFAQAFAQIAHRLAVLGGRVVFANIPDVDKTGIVVDGQDLMKFLGSDFGLPAGSFTTAPTMLLIRLGLLDADVLQDPNFVLDATEAVAIAQRIQQFNQIIALNAATVGAPVVDINTLFKTIAANPPVVLGVPFTHRFLGGIFSLDGVHPGDLAQAIVANAFIHRANEAFQMHIPEISEAEMLRIFGTDPFVDKDQDGVVRGRPLAGLLETLGPLLGISGDLDDSIPNASGPRIDRSRGTQFMHQYFAFRGQSAQTRWDRSAAIEAMRHTFGLRKR